MDSLVRLNRLCVETFKLLCMRIVPKRLRARIIEFDGLRPIEDTSKSFPWREKVAEAGDIAHIEYICLL